MSARRNAATAPPDVPALYPGIVYRLTRDIEPVGPEKRGISRVDDEAAQILTAMGWTPPRRHSGA